VYFCNVLQKQRLKETYFLMVMLFLAVLPASSHAFTMHCASVGASGDVTVSWDRNGTSTANFRSWYLFHSTSGLGPFTLIDSLLINSDTTDNQRMQPTALLIISSFLNQTMVRPIFTQIQFVLLV
jgi:hypothetical protein